MKQFKERLEIFAKAQYGMGQTRFEDYCGIAHGTMSAIKASGPSASVLTRIAVKCPELNLNWLFRGEGEMLVSSQEQHSAPAPRGTDEENNSQKKEAPEVEVSVVNKAGAVIISDVQALKSIISSAVVKALEDIK